MCDYSLMHLASRPAKVDDKLTVKRGNAGTTGFLEPGAEGTSVAICVLPGTELAFDAPITVCPMWINGESIPSKTYEANLARFRQTDTDKTHTHHDALELSTGEIIKLTNLVENQTATVLQLPAVPQTPEEAKQQERVAIVA